MHFSRITFDSSLYYGKPLVKGTRIPVYCVLELVAEGKSFEEIVKNHYPILKVEDVAECVLFAATLLKDEAVSLPYPPRRKGKV